MSTMYYLRRKPCDHCGQAPDDLPIGLSAGGWRFLWRGYHAPDEDGFPSRPGRELGSPSQWWDYLARRVATGDVIVDEYERVHELADFRAFVEAKREKAKVDRAGDGAIRVEGDDVSFEAFS